MTTIEKLYEVIKNVYSQMNKTSLMPLSEISESTDLKDELGLDSLSFVMIMLETENMLGIELDAGNMMTCKTVGDVIKIVENSTK